MGVQSYVRSTWVEAAAVARIVPELPKVFRFGRWSPGRLLRERAAREPDGLGLLYLDRRFTWSELDRAANRYADFCARQGLCAGDVVALVFDNRPEFLFAQMGLSKLGVVSALINPNLTGAALEHAITLSRARVVLAGAEHVSALQSVKEKLGLALPSRDLWVVLDDDARAPAELVRVIDAELAASADTEPSPARPVRTLDASCYVYTSGTTGLPKAAIITNQRFLLASCAFGRSVHEAGPGDVIYVTLPLYHSSAQWVGWGSCMATGATMALRRRFSASRFWEDVREFRATRFLYIGELCRYLLNQPPRSDDRDHNLRLGVGNGLRPELWAPFQERFAVPLMREFYGATEGNAPIINLEGRRGMVGRLRRRQVVVRCDLATGEVLRNRHGFCEEAERGESGLLLGRIGGIAKFDGYVSQEATRAKILRDVFKRGDEYFNSGDLLTVHEDGWVSFADRVGDTFRWKGENVSTHEVEQVLNRAPGVLDSNVYGVGVPGTEGRVGMAGVTVAESFDLETLARHVVEHLAAYQRPYFLRLQQGMRVTATLKHQKVGYRNEGYDPNGTTDPLYFLADGAYVPLDVELFGRLQRGDIAPR